MASIALAHGTIPDEKCNNTFSGSILDVGRDFQPTGNHAYIILSSPLMFAIIYNNPPETPIISLGASSGIPLANYAYSISTIDPDGDKMQYLFDWGDGTTSTIGPVDSGTIAGANHTWTKAGRYEIKAKATDSQGAASGWSESFNVTIDASPDNPSIPSGPSSGRPGTNYAYIVSAFDHDGDQINYTFDWGDGTTSIIGPVDSGTKASANHSWSKAATYQIRANATDSLGKSSGWSDPLIVTLNNPPDKPSVPSGPSSGRPGIHYVYTVSATDPDEDPISYTFDWGDGTTSIIGPVDSGIVASLNHTWTRAGTDQVKAKAIDGKGATSEWSESWTVIINAPPNKPATPSGSKSVYAWASNSYSTLAADPDEDSVEYTFDWGDGNTSTTNFVKSGSNANTLHIWSNEGTYQIKTIASDSSGDTSRWSDFLTITVIANNKPNVPRSLFGPSSGYVGIAHSYFTLAKDTDNDMVKYTFDWGDGTISETDLVNSGSVESASHMWRKAGTYHVRGNATDSRGASSVFSKPLNVTIADNDPPDTPIVPSGPTSGRSSTTYDYATTANDPDGDHVRYVFDWGDGTTSWTGSGFTNSGISEPVLHKWSKAGVYQVKAMAMDDKGATSRWSNAQEVNIS